MAQGHGVRLGRGEIAARRLSSAHAAAGSSDSPYVFAIGPSVTYRTKDGVHFTGEWHREVEAENRFGGDKVWLKLVLPL